MKTCAIICEYNPLHNGHIKLIEYAKTIADKIVCIMSGNFTQRAMPAVADKYSRARHAIFAGADAVVELPTVHACASAQNFAHGAVRIAMQLGCDYLAFGSECGDLPRLQQCANDSNPSSFAVKQALQGGISYPKAMSILLPQYSDILDCPNNTLAIEYLKSISQLKAKIIPITLKRPNNYNSNLTEGSFVSATAIRANIDSPHIGHYLKDYVIADYNRDIENTYKDFASNHLALTPVQILSQIEGVSEGLHNKLFANATLGDYDSIINNVKSKRYTQLRIQRIILCQTLGITKQLVKKYSDTEYPILLLAISNKSSNSLFAHWQEIGANVATSEKDSSEIDTLSNRLYQSLSGKAMPHSVQKIIES